MREQLEGQQRPERSVREVAVGDALAALQITADEDRAGQIWRRLDAGWRLHQFGVPEPA